MERVMMNNENKPTRKQQVFIDEYLRCFNASEAARRAGYSEARARITGSELLADSNISEQIQARLAEVHMSADEALKMVADIARGDLGEFMNDFGGVDIVEARKAGKTRLIKRWKTQTTTINGKQEDKEIHTEEIELYDSQAALRDVLKVHGRFAPDKLDVTSNGETLKPEEMKPSEIAARVAALLQAKNKDANSG
jgi:phage terminase small subunit